MAEYKKGLVGTPPFAENLHYKYIWSFDSRFHCPNRYTV
jgi:hypothetical protein